MAQGGHYPWGHGVVNQRELEYAFVLVRMGAREKRLLKGKPTITIEDIREEFSAQFGVTAPSRRTLRDKYLELEEARIRGSVFLSSWYFVLATLNGNSTQLK